MVTRRTAHPRADDMAKISKIIRSEPELGKLVEQDLVRGVKNPGRGARGMGGEQALRILIVKQRAQLSYEELEFTLRDSQTYRAFCLLGIMDAGPSRSALQENLSKITPDTLEKISRRVVRLAAERKVEKADRVRIDSTTVDANIHVPSDSGLLYDGVRVLATLFGAVEAASGFEQWHDHTPSAKRHMRDIHSTRSAKKQRASYEKLLEAVAKTRRYTKPALEHLQGREGRKVERLAARLKHYDELLRKVVDQTERRILKGEKVPAGERIVSLFEPHADVIVKDHKNVYYGHKITISSGRSGMILDCVVESGNPNDATCLSPMLDRHEQIFGHAPRQIAADGNYASAANLDDAKRRGVRDVCFTRRRGMEVEDMASSGRTYRMLKRFRAGVEATISFLKRVFGLDRCTWKGESSFSSYVWGSIVSANLLVLARRLPA